MSSECQSGFARADGEAPRWGESGWFTDSENRRLFRELRFYIGRIRADTRAQSGDSVLTEILAGASFDDSVRGNYHRDTEHPTLMSGQTVMSSDMNLFDLLEDTFLEEDIEVKDELFVDNYGDDVIAVSPGPPSFLAISLYWARNVCTWFSLQSQNKSNTFRHVYFTRKKKKNIEIHRTDIRHLTLEIML